MIPIWQASILIVMLLSCISIVMQAYAQKANAQDRERTKSILTQNEVLSAQINELQREIEQLTAEMGKIMEENSQLNREVVLLTEEVSRLQERFGGCNPVECNLRNV